MINGSALARWAAKGIGTTIAWAVLSGAILGAIIGIAFLFAS